MNIEFRKANIGDAELLIDIYNSSFYSDYKRYGECPAYGKTKEMMERSLIDYSKFLIFTIAKRLVVSPVEKKKTEYMKSVVYASFRSFREEESERLQ